MDEKPKPPTENEEKAVNRPDDDELTDEDLDSVAGGLAGTCEGGIGYVSSGASKGSVKVLDVTE